MKLVTKYTLASNSLIVLLNRFGLLDRIDEVVYHADEIVVSGDYAIHQIGTDVACHSLVDGLRDKGCTSDPDHLKNFVEVCRTLGAAHELARHFNMLLIESYGVGATVTKIGRVVGPRVHFTLSNGERWRWNISKGSASKLDPNDGACYTVERTRGPRVRTISELHSAVNAYAALALEPH